MFCPPYFDSVYCWPAASPDTIVKIKCSEIFKFAGHEQDTIHHLEHEYFAYRKCLSDGQWDWNGWTNYSQCLTLLNLQVRFIKNCFEDLLRIVLKKSNLMFIKL